MSTQADTAVTGGWLTSFRAKFVALIGSAVLLSLLLGGGIALWNVQKLSRDASAEIESGLSKATEEYLNRYIDMTAQRADLMFARTYDQVNLLAQFSQSLIDQPVLGEGLSTLLADFPNFKDTLVYDQTGNWIQNTPETSSVVSIWGYLLDGPGKMQPGVEQAVRDTSYFGLVAPHIMSTGPTKLQTYFLGPRAYPFLRTTPYSEQAQTFDKLYPGHNELNWWDFFFPSIYEAWQGWAGNPAARPVQTDITVLAPYVDAVTGNLIVSFFHPLYTKDRTDVAGIVGVDVTPQQLTELVQGVKIAETGFAFLAQQDGNIVTISEAGEALLGVTPENTTGSGVTSLDLSLAKSRFPEIASLQIPPAGTTTITEVMVEKDGKSKKILVALHPLEPMNMWQPNEGISARNLVLGFVVPDSEIYASLYAAQDEINAATDRIAKGILISVVSFLFVVLAVSVAISRRFTSGLVTLADAAGRLARADYDIQVPVRGRDEVARVGAAFNTMAREIRDHTETLEQRVADRTSQLASANDEIQSLYAKLKDENIRMGAELDVARRIQTMVLPTLAEHDSIPELEIASFVEPADEVGGDYYDVLYTQGRAKIGIGDVTGHGVESGVLMLMVQSVARALHERGLDDPSMFLEVLNRAIYKNTERTQSGKHLSLAFLDYADGVATIAGQHEEFILIRQDGTVQRIDTIDLGFPIGLEEDIGDFLSSIDVPFLQGDMMVLYSDGVTEAESESGELYEMDRLIASALRHHHKTAPQAVDAIIADLRAHIGTQKVHDDITLVVLKHR
jgi:sigma-B regulation protein RsbU (phosphoserine phosphatase)